MGDIVGAVAGVKKGGGRVTINGVGPGAFTCRGIAIALPISPPTGAPSHQPMHYFGPPLPSPASNPAQATWCQTRPTCPFTWGPCLKR